MIFRANEAAQTRLEEVERYFLRGLREMDDASLSASKKKLRELTDALGPAVDDYPAWHPLVSNNDDDRHPMTRPDDKNGYRGLDHTRHFVNGFITAPYSDGQEVVDSVEALPENPAAYIEAEILDFPLYNSSVKAVVVRVQWRTSLLADGTIPLSIAMPLLLEKELPCWRWAKCPETWENMRPFFLGTPHGSRSSLFINAENGQKMKSIWQRLIATGMFGVLR